MTDAIALPHPQFTPRNRLLLAVFIGVVTFVSSYYISHLTGIGAGDLRYSKWLASDWLSGKNPYQPFAINNEYDIVPYPFTAVLVTLPLVWMPDRIAAAVFSGVGATLLAWLILDRGKNWQLWLLASWPFVNSVIFTQWSPFIVSMFFTPGLVPLLFIKPQQALPFIFIQKPNRTSIILAGLLLVISLVLYPSWPLDWSKTLHNYIGFPPLFILPFGPLLLFALLRYREKRAWLLILLALMPQRMVYDQLGVLLVAENRNQMLFLVLCSWISFPALIFLGGWNAIPWGWQQWVLLESYLPALIVVLFPVFRNLVPKIYGFLRPA